MFMSPRDAAAAKERFGDRVEVMQVPEGMVAVVQIPPDKERSAGPLFIQYNEIYKVVRHYKAVEEQLCQELSKELRISPEEVDDSLEVLLQHGYIESNMRGGYTICLEALKNGPKVR